MLKLNPTPQPYHKSLIRSLIVWVFAIFILGEFFLRVGELVFPNLNHFLQGKSGVGGAKFSEMIPNPYSLGHDERGYPNPKGMTRADTVVLGDLQSYGLQGHVAKSWPAFLGKLAEKQIYNLSFPAAGPVNHYENLNTALALHPKTIMVGIYLGDDFLNAYERTYHDQSATGFRNSDEIRIREFHELEKKNPLRGKGSLIADNKVQLSSEKGRIHERLFRHVAWVRLWTAALRNMSQPHDESSILNQEDWDRVKQGVEASKNSYDVIDTPRLKTVFQPEYHRLALDRNDGRILEGLRITRETLREMQDRLQKENIRFTVFLIPTKESSYEQLMDEQGLKKSEKYSAVVANESYFRNQMIGFLRATMIEYVDLLPVFQQAIKKNFSLYYPFANNGSLTREGHVLIAESVHEALREKDFSRTDQAEKKPGWEYRTYKDRNKDLELKTLVGIVSFALLLILIFTRLREVIRPILLLSVYVFYLLFQSLYLIEFFPLTAFQMFSFVEEKTVFYDKLIAVLQDGKEVKIQDYHVLPMLADGRAKRYVDDAFKNSEIANEFASTYAKAYAKRFKKTGAPGVAEVRFERWRWNFLEDPNDPLKGFLAKRVIGKPYEDPDDA